jgi:hypothetical protein
MTFGPLFFTESLLEGCHESPNSTRRRAKTARKDGSAASGFTSH